MKKHCKELEQHLKSGAESLPDALRAHMARCERCRRVWRSEQFYRRVLQAARSEPTPVCDVAWVRVQARLAERAVARPRPMLWRLAPAFGVATIALIALFWNLHTDAPQPSQVAQNAEPVVGSAGMPAPPPALEAAAAAPLFSDTARLETPNAPPKLDTELRLARPQPAETPVRAQASVQVMDAPNAGVGSLSLSFAESNDATNSSDTASYLQVAALPLSQFRVGEGAEVHYLPFNYGNSQPEGANENAMVGSF
ncbi:MAG: hypothetical protein NZM28_03110 [Fimbriimonadales bacterium]|nr:hypothetical protein [Fimbriimonadales bacterium]